MIHLVTTLVKNPGCNAEKVRQPGYCRAVLNLYKPPTREVLLNETPTLIKAKVRRKCIKYWGPYRVLCRGEDTVCGMTWYAPSEEVVERLRAYETDAYDEHHMRIELENGNKIVARAFM